MTIELSSSQTAPPPEFSTPDSLSAELETWQRHIRALAEEIGPRGSTTEGERRGHEYCQRVLAGLGFEPQWESFRSARSAFHPFLLVALFILGAYLIYPLFGRVSVATAALLALVVFIFAVMELTLRENPLRKLVAKAGSQNVVAQLPSQEVHRQDLVLIGHVDSQHTPLIFQSSGWLRAYQVFSTSAFVAFAGMVLLYILGIFTQWGWIWPVSTITAVFALLLGGVCLQAVSSPFTCGANDNATAAGLVLALAGSLGEAPLKYTRLWLVCTGSEEALHDGAIDFFRQHRREMVNPKTLVFEGLGGAGPSWLVKEGIVLPILPDPELIALAESVSRQHPELGAYPSQLSGGVTEMSDSIKAGVPALTLMGLTRDNALPYWHQIEDTVDHIDPQALARNYAFAWHFIQAYDRQAKSGQQSGR